MANNRGSGLRLMPPVLLCDANLSAGLELSAVANRQELGRVGRPRTRGGELVARGCRVEPVCRNGVIREDGDNVLVDLDKAAVDVIATCLLPFRDAKLAVAQTSDERAVSRCDTKLAVIKRQ